MLQKQSVNINFTQGLDTKTDPFQVQLGKFLSLQNSVFDKAGRLTKRNGYGPLASLPVTTTQYLTTFNGNLTALGQQLYAYSEGSKNWVNKGNLQLISLDTLPAIRNEYNQSQADSAQAANGLVCVAYTEDQTSPATGITTETYKYAVLDSTTGQMIVNPTTMNGFGGTGSQGAGTPRVFVVGSYFFVVLTTQVFTPGPTVTNHIQIYAISTTNPTATPLQKDVVSGYNPSSTVSWDAAVVNNTLYLAYNTTSGGQNVSILTVSQTLVVSAPHVFTGEIATMMSVTADTTNMTAPVIWLSYYDAASSVGKMAAVNANLTTALAPTTFVSGGAALLNITSLATNGVATVYYEAFVAPPLQNQIKSRTCTQSGTLGSVTTIIGLGLASKAFYNARVPYLLGTFNSNFQPTYFLINALTSQIVSKLSYSNGAGYYTKGLPSATNHSGVISLSYLKKDLIQAANTSGTSATASPAPQTFVQAGSNVYSQTGVSLVAFNLNQNQITSGEIGSTLNFSGGFVTSYDGVTPVEQGFFVFPEGISAFVTSNGGPSTATGNITTGSNQITNFTGTALIGESISGTGIPANTIVTQLSGTTLTINNNATATTTGVSLSYQPNMASQPDGTTNTNAYAYSVTYEWTDNQGNLFRSAPSIPLFITTGGTHTTQVQLTIPNLLLTYKTNVSIVIYRWSVAQQVYYQVTPVNAPLTVSSSVASIQYTDVFSDAQILGNNILYTTGGVVENVSPPATDNVALFNNRLWLVDAEDRNLLWFSKQVIESTPVEMSDLLTLYVAPATASEGSTGPITAIAPMDDKLIIFKQNALGYINGIGPDNTGSNNQYSDFILINSVVGCTNQNSIVFTPQGLMFQSNKGIWLLGRDLSTTYIGYPVESLTTGATVNNAVNIPSTNQVRFTLSSGITLLYDYFYGQWGTFTNVPAISSTIFQNLHTYANSLGQVFQETVGSYLDNTSPVLMSFTTSWINLAGLQGFERFYQMYLLGQYLSPFSLAVQIAYDYNPSMSQSTVITPSQTPVTWGSDALWGSGTSWGSVGGNAIENAGNVFEARLFPQRQKCESFQVTVSEVGSLTTPGAGLTLSGLNLIVGGKRGFRTSPASRNFG